MDNTIELIRIKIPENRILHKGKAEEYFEIYDNTQGLTEEYLYAHQPTTKDTIPIYSTSEKRIGLLDKGWVTNKFNVISGPAIIVARKGYAGRLYVVEDKQFIVHEDAYPIKPKKAYEGDINLWWFVGHYSMAFQSDRTSFWGIGDFPRERFRNSFVLIPDIKFQDKAAQLYRHRQSLVSRINVFKENFHRQIDSSIKGL